MPPSHLSIGLRFVTAPIGFLFCYSCLLHGKWIKPPRASNSGLVPCSCSVLLRVATLLSLLPLHGFDAVIGKYPCHSVDPHSHWWAWPSYPVQETGTPHVNCLVREAMLTMTILSWIWFGKGPPHLHTSILHFEVRRFRENAGFGGGIMLSWDK